ncbi:Relaxase/mobilization nuclease family protein [Niastella koreensis GR20-10]|uniref:Relaxase/mobilization nuclease family protein n=1 Tax=Niastella koreensis (strain DSM 17620 / KACC 11465 / NBRC 106392 / GR20-10) TaxID=700598 RepID=G8THN3_NIAKG|nr:relaxase/mobilization nuclease domain-containing protein [Niastella koreensis]AEV97461.1 Relaxase/mobilization nuclease family protein [Niastella koreensis GR20-10]
MVARIIKGSSLSNTLNYNEHKVQQGVAECIHSANYAKDTEKLNFFDKLRRLEHQAALNENVKANSVHISLNFDSADQLDKEKLTAIADTYMQQIGFGSQPYLIYEHRDAGHKHIHIVTTNIQQNGRRIDMNNIGRNQSEKARKAIEQEFKLVPAEYHKQDQKQQHKQELVVSPKRVEYGKTETKRAIQNILDYVIRRYKYTSLPELNAVLKQYNVMADPGKEGSRIHKNGGLVYRVLDAGGSKIGVPIKASAFYNKPTLKTLEQLFPRNELLRQNYKIRVKNSIDLALIKPVSVPDLKELLRKEGIAMELRQNDQGLLYGITYVDHRNQCVFNGSDLGKQYSAKAIQECCLRQDHQPVQIEKLQQKIQQESNYQFVRNNLQHHLKDTPLKSGTVEEDFKLQGLQKAADLLTTLMKQEQVENQSLPEWIKRKKKKHRHRL